MKQVGPELTTLTHRLAECPPDCYETPLGPRTKQHPVVLNVGAIVSDHFRDLGFDFSLLADTAETICNLNDRQKRMALIAVWLLRDPWLMEHVDNTDVASLLADGLNEIADIVAPAKAVSDPDRREELARVCLRELGFRPAGETLQQASDRLNTLDSVERIRVIGKTRAAESRARKIREAMAKKAAEEAAARYSPE